MSQRQPHEYPRRILLCVTGLSPQVMTETLFALAVQRQPAFVPTEIHVVSTSDGIERADYMLLSKSQGYFRRLQQDHGLPEIAFSRATMHEIRGMDCHPLADIRTPDDNAAAADTITQLVSKLTRDPEAAVHVSIAGGRKTLGFYLGYALSLFGRPQDRLSHVLVSPDFENLKDFFYPTPGEHIIFNRDGKPLDAAQARVELAEIPFVRLRDDLPEAAVNGLVSFGDIVRAAETSRAEPHLRVLIGERAIECNGVRVDLPPQSFAVYGWLAERCWDEVEGVVSSVEFNNPESTLRNGLKLFGDHVFRNKFASGVEQWEQWNPDNTEWLFQRLHDLDARLTRALGPAGAKPYLVKRIRLGGRRNGYQLDLAPEQIEIVQA
jgi:CRISPR-associated protein (TIGR02584 family)